MIRWKTCTAISLLVLAAGCSEDPAVTAAKKAEAEAQKVAAAMKKDEAESKIAITAGLKDPASAKFGKFTLAGVVKGLQTACLTVNAKNSFGGYTGDREAIMTKIEGKWVVMQLGMNIVGHEISHQECINMMKST